MDTEPPLEGRTPEKLDEIARRRRDALLDESLREVCRLGRSATMAYQFRAARTKLTVFAKQ